jgi:hypothetical protein
VTYVVAVVIAAPTVLIAEVRANLSTLERPLDGAVAIAIEIADGCEVLSA